MRPLKPLILLGLLTTLLSLAVPAPAADGAAVSARLEAALAEKSGPHLVWVFFADKGLEAAAREAALTTAEADLPARTAWRRAKGRPAGAPLVDARDLALSESYLASVTATGAVLRHESRWLNAVSLAADAASVAAIADLPFVARLDLVATGRRPVPSVTESQPRPPSKGRWTLDYGGNLDAMEQANVPPVHEAGISGQGVIIGLLDSGFRTTHTALDTVEVLATYDFVNDDTNVDTEDGDPVKAKDHGTMVLSTAMGFAPGRLIAPAHGARALLAKTEDVADEQPIEEDYWVAGLEWLELNGADIVNSSLSYTDWYEWSDMDGNTAVTTVAADLAVGRGVVVVNSAGNARAEAWGHIGAPADGDSVITVGAVTPWNAIADFSSPGPSYDGRIKPDVSALGYANYVVDPDTDAGYRTASGTSFSSPLTTGVAALVLSRVPALTPMQVREALRETAHLAHAPDNDFGWGILNAWEAVRYFGPRFAHEAHPDTEDTLGPYTVTVEITDRVGVDPAESRLWYRADGGPWTPVFLSVLPKDHLYFGTLAGQPAGTVVDYYFTAAGVEGVPASLPHRAPDTWFTFRVGLDTEAPVITHKTLRTQALAAWPPTLICLATDNLGVDRVELTFQVNDGPQQGPVLFTATGGDTYELEFPLGVSALAPGDWITYTLTARDQSYSANTVDHGPHLFQVIDALGVALILDDADPLIPVHTNADSLAAWITRAGFLADILPADEAGLLDFQGYQAVVVSSGDHPVPLVDDNLRLALRDHVAAGGRLLLEGGDIGAVMSPDTVFMAEVLHCQTWVLDGAGDMKPAAGRTNHPLLNRPHALPGLLELTYGGNGDQDAMVPAPDAVLVSAPVLFPDYGGVVAYDDNTAPQAGQIVYMAFNLGALDPVAAEPLAVNALSYLTAPELPPTARLAGRVELNGEEDHAGVTVQLDTGVATVTATDGTWSLPNLYDAHYTLRLSKPGWTSSSETVYLSAGADLSGLEHTLEPVVYTTYSTTPNLPIPDFNSGGVTSVITVPLIDADSLVSLTVDINITHPWRGDLFALLTSPSGEFSVLHNRSGDSAQNLVGNYEATLVVDGPGALADFEGVFNRGDWTLRVSDGQLGQSGTLVSWGLNFTLPGEVSNGEDVPKATRLVGNIPNPFNPTTLISYEVAQTADVRLLIYDLRGRLVRDLLAEPRTVGRYVEPWDGKDNDGRNVGSGAYLYRMEAGRVVEHRKMMLVR